MCIFTKNKSINALQHLKHAREIMMINKKLAFKLTILPLILGSASHTAMAYGNDEVKKDDVEKIREREREERERETERQKERERNRERENERKREQEN